MFLVGLTGGIACGKSSVAEVFVKNNIPFINADHISRQSELSRQYFDSFFTLNSIDNYVTFCRLA